METATLDDNCSNLTQGMIVELVAGDGFFGPDCFTMKANAHLTVRNVGVRRHNFVVSEEEFRKAPWAVEIGNLERGQMTLTSESPIGDYLEPGIYEFFCNYHAGMDGVIEIVEPVL